MIRAATVLAVLVLVGASGCATTRRQAAEDDLRALEKRRAGGAKAAELQPHFGAVATQALAAARAGDPEPATVVRLYAIAAQAAWQAGPAGEAVLLDSSTEGSFACRRLPQRSASAPRDCAIILVALPFGVYQHLLGTLRGLVARRDALRDATPPQQLPASTRPEVERLYGHFESQVEKLGRIRDELASEGVGAELCDWVDRARRPVYCGAAATASLALDVEGATVGGPDDPSEREAALRLDVERTQGAIDCGAVPAGIELP